MLIDQTKDQMESKNDEIIVVLILVTKKELDARDQTQVPHFQLNKHQTK